MDSTSCSTKSERRELRFNRRSALGRFTNLESGKRLKSSAQMMYGAIVMKSRPSAHSNSLQTAIWISGETTQPGDVWILCSERKNQKRGVRGPQRT